jgi:hypothetical protein
LTLQSHIDDIIPDWKLEIEYIPASESVVEPSLLSAAIKQGDSRELLRIKKALERDIALLKMRIIDEEQKISEYMVEVYVFIC